MKSICALALLATLALGAPAFAQDAGQPGATGTAGTLTGSNPGTSGPNATVHTRRHMMMRHHMMRRRHRHMMMHQNGM